MYPSARSSRSISVPTLSTLLLVSLALGCGGASDAPGTLESGGGPETAPMTNTEALIVTQAAVLDERFSLERVLQQLVDQRPFGTQTAATLYAQWWDLQNDASHAVTEGPHCNGFVNGFPVQCPRQEGLLAAENPFDGNPDDYIPIALVNRFDLAPADGAHCGEYRIIYGKTSSLGLLFFLDRNLIIIEAQMPNPHPELGLEGCRPVADLWADVAATPLLQRAAKLEQFYFDGIEGFPPAIHIDNLSGEAGQIRTNQFMTLRDYFGEGILLQPWQLREFKIVKPLFSADIQIRQVTVKDSPFAKLYNDRAFSFRGPGFRNQFLPQVAALAQATSVNDLSVAVPDIYNAGQSTEQGNESNAVAAFEGAVAQSPEGGDDFAAAIQAELDAIGSPLTPTQIVRRAMATSCAGCHQLSTSAPNNDLGGGLTFPASMGFVQVSEQNVVFCDNPFQGFCFQMSPALRNEFLPRRLEILNEFLAGGIATNQGAMRVH